VAASSARKRSRKSAIRARSYPCGGRIDEERDEVLSVDADVDASERDQTATEKKPDNDERHRSRDLDDGERATNRESAATRRACRFLEGARKSL
jgi:hypothetical protein